jgi:hypothetical protein
MPQVVKLGNDYHVGILRLCSDHALTILGDRFVRCALQSDGRASSSVVCARDARETSTSGWS